MRISDWSSDVCSSDLVAHLYPNAAAEPPAAKQHLSGRGELRGIVEQQRQETAQQVRIGAHHGAGRHHAKIEAERRKTRRKALLQPGKERLQRHRLQRGLQQALVGGLQVAQRIQPGIRQVRSEEHTSELQSLMRISYAVFCLKKKKQ